MPTQPYIIGGKRVPSVTTILGKFKDPGALMYWSNKVATDVLVEAVSLLQDVAAIELNNQDHSLLRQPAFVISAMNGSINRFLQSKPLDRANHRHVSENACTAGTICHDTVQAYIEHVKAGGKPKTFLDRISLFKIMGEYRCNREIGIAALNGISAFKTWIQSNKFELVETEKPLLSRKHLYGGTLDCIGYLESPVQQRILFDWKTSNAVYSDYLCQLAAYVMLWEENFPDQPIDCCHLLRFDKTSGDFTDHHFVELEEAKEMFLLLRRCYEIQKTLDKRV